MNEMYMEYLKMDVKDNEAKIAREKDHLLGQLRDLERDVQKAIEGAVSRDDYRLDTFCDNRMNDLIRILRTSNDIGRRQEKVTLVKTLMKAE